MMTRNSTWRGRFAAVLALACTLAVPAFASANCIDGPKRPASRGWTPWETIRTHRDVDLQVRYHSDFAGPFGTGREKGSLQFRYVNRSSRPVTATSRDFYGSLLQGSAFFRTRETFRHVPFGLEDEVVDLAPGEILETGVQTFDGRLCSYNVSFYVWRR